MLFWWASLACTSLPEQEATTMTGAYFAWVDFNHRVSTLRFGVDDTDAELAVIGGTSTTNTPPDLDATCNPDECDEIPALDRSLVRLGWSRLTTDTVALGTGSVALDVPRGGATGTVAIELPRGATGPATAILRGFALDTDRPLSGDPACYRPEYGWHPQRFAMAIDDVTLDGDTATVTVAAQFDAGPTEEAIRACVDEVYERAVVGITVDVLVIAGAEATAQTVESAANYPFSGNAFDPEPQDEVAPTALATRGTLEGFASVDFAFEGDDGLGVYLRTFGFEITEAGAAGIATNFSRFTQQTDLSYTFTGEVLAIDVPGEVSTGTVEVAELETVVDADDTPIFQRFAL